MRLCNMYKLLLTALIAAALILLAVPLKVSADSTSDGFEYKVINGNEIQIRGYTGSLTEVTIPETIDGKTVTTLYELKGGSVTRVTIPKTVKLIYGAAFLMPNLAEVCFDGLNEDFVTVGKNAFPDSVKKITFPPDLTDRDVKTKMTLVVFPSEAELYSGTEPLPHDYIYTPADAEQHYKKCTACDYIDPGSFEDHVCEGDFFAKPGWNSETNHFQKCRCGMVIGNLHVWEDNITAQATCTSPGVKTRVCTECGAEKTEEIPKLPHSYNEGVCSVCGDKDPDHTSTDTKPPVTEPPVTEPPVTEPPVTEPSVTEPPVTEPPVTEPPVTESSGTEPSVTEPVVTEPVIIPPSITPLRPTIITTAPKTSGKEPYIRGYNGKTGWEAISDTISDTPDGGTVTVNMNGTTKLPKNIVAQIQGRDVTLVLDMGGGFVWSVNGTSVTKARNIDMGVRKASRIPGDSVKEYFGDIKTVQIDLRHSGDFGFTAELSIDLGNRYNGMYANSYCYKSGNFEFGDSGEIVNGQAGLKFDHASSWLITVESSPVREDVSSAAAAHSPDIPIDVSDSVSGRIAVGKLNGHVCF